MVAGNWINQDGLALQFGTSKAIPEAGGDYLVYGETREIEQYIPLVPYQLTAAMPAIPAVPTTFAGGTAGTGTAAAAGIQSLTTFMPLQVTAPVVTTTGGVLLLTQPQLFVESVEIETLVGATGGTSLAVGLALINPVTQAFVQVTPNAGAQLVTSLAIANFATAGQRWTSTVPSTTGLRWDTVTAVGTSGAWLGNAPLFTNTFAGLPPGTQFPTNAYLSTIATGAFTNGLLKIRVRYHYYGNISY